MAKKKRKAPKKSPGPSKRSRSRPQPQGKGRSSLPDRRALEGLMHDVLRRSLGDGGETPLDQAQEIIYEAYEADDPGERVALARKALEVAADCADAYVLLAENAGSRKEALELYTKGVEAGARALGPELFREAAGHFWGLLETRPYMRARLGLADTLWTLGRRTEAVEHLQEMLRLNPNDNQGLRYALAGWLLNLDRDEDLARLLDQYPDEGSAAWAYTRTLLAFRREGDTPETRKRLQEAKKRNPHVPGFLLGHEPMPRQQPPYYSPGDPDEAILYAGTSLAGWKATPGALSWLKDQEKGTKGRRSSAAKAKAKAKTKGPTDEVKQRLRKLRQEFDVWQADCRQLSHWVEVAGEPVLPWMLLVTSRSNDLVLAHDLTEEEPTAEHLWDKLAEAMKKPMMGKTHRPTTLQFRPGGRWEALAPHLDALEIACEPTDDLDQLDFVFEALKQQLAGDAPPGLLEMPGITPPQVAGFYQAAAGFYHKAPWRSIGYETAIEVACDRFESGPWYAVIMGQSGLTIGLALYDDLKILKRLWNNDLSDEENARETVALTVTFDMETEIPAPDLEATRRHGWEVASPEAYPSIFRKERGMSMRPPLAWELELMEGCLRALPEFVARHQADDLAPHSLTVPTASGELTLVLRWVED
jgi:tetratricopeptide (TPR) repeat protein